MHRAFVSKPLEAMEAYPADRSRTTEAAARKTSSRLVEGLEFQAAGLLSVIFRAELRSFGVSGSLRMYRGLSFDEASGANTDQSRVSGESRERECNAGRSRKCPSTVPRKL